MTSCLPPCTDVPDGLDATDLSTNGALISWNATMNADSYGVRYKRFIDPDWTEFITNNTSYNFTDLVDCTEYVFAVKSRCPGDQESDYSEVFEFNTECILGINKTPADVAEWSVMPNPFQDQCTLEITTTEATNLKIDLFDTSGKTDFFKKYPVRSGTEPDSADP